MVYVWLGLIVAFIAVEAATVNLVSIWFIGGAVAGLVCAILDVSALLQWAVFIAVSAGLLALLRPVLKKYLRVKPTKTNADRLVGQEALVTEQIDNLRDTYLRTSCKRIKRKGLYENIIISSRSSIVYIQHRLLIENKENIENF